MTNTNNITVAPKELLKIEKINQEHNLTVSVLEGATFEGVFFQNGHPLTVTVLLEGENSSCDLKAVYCADVQNPCDITFNVIHKHSKTFSTQQINGVVAKGAKAVFNGLIHIPFHCAGCTGHQQHHAVLLDSNAVVEATPALEIYNDDVECSHGSSVGALDEQQLFYLYSRGISEKEAKKILINGFLNHILPPAFSITVTDWMNNNV